jgi:hypothetical protein
MVYERGEGSTWGESLFITHQVTFVVLHHDLSTTRHMAGVNQQPQTLV